MSGLNRSQCRERLPSVHSRHAEVKEDQADLPLPFLENFQSPIAIRGCNHGKTQLSCEQGFDHIPHRHLIIDKQDQLAFRSSSADRGILLWRCRSFLFRQGQEQPEGCTDMRLAIHCNCPPNSAQQSGYH